MYVLKKDNVERIVIDENIRDKLLKDGYEEIREEIESEYAKLTVEQLKAIATEKGIEFDAKIKKVGLIALLDAEDGE